MVRRIKLAVLCPRVSNRGFLFWHAGFDDIFSEKPNRIPCFPDLHLFVNLLSPLLSFFYSFLQKIFIFFQTVDQNKAMFHFFDFWNNFLIGFQVRQKHVLILISFRQRTNSNSLKSPNEISINTCFWSFQWVWVLSLSNSSWCKSEIVCLFKWSLKFIQIRFYCWRDFGLESYNFQRGPCSVNFIQTVQMLSSLLDLL